MSTVSLPTGALRAAPSRVEQVADEVRRWAQAAAAGDRLGTKDDLRRRCGVAAGTVNEAVRLLVSEGWIELRRGPGGGIFVGRPSPIERLSVTLLSLDDEGASVAEAYQVRAQLDELLVQHAVLHATAEHHVTLHEQVAEMTAAYEVDDRARFAQANWTIHDVICEASPNTLLRTIYRSLLAIIEAHVGVRSAPRTPTPREARERFAARVQVHAQLVEAISRRDAAAASAAIRQHNDELWVGGSEPA